MSDPIDEAATKAMLYVVRDGTNFGLNDGRYVRLAILRGMLERGTYYNEQGEERPSQGNWLAMLSAEIDQLTKESP